MLCRFARAVGDLAGGVEDQEVMGRCGPHRLRYICAVYTDGWRQLVTLRVVSHTTTDFCCGSRSAIFIFMPF